MADKPTADKKNKKNKKRSAEIIGVFAKHNFYTNGFTPSELRTTLEDLGPTYVKIGQIMSSRTDMLPKEYCQELEELRSKVSPLEASIVREVIEQEAGKKIDEIYSDFRDEPLGSASIGQAHYGVLLDGTRVVTKVQRPGIAEMMREDFALLKKLAGLVSIGDEEEGEGGGVNLTDIIIELEKVTEEELDFRVEADNTRIFRELCIEDETVVSCPQIIDELTTERILTMTFVDGYSLSHTERIDRDGYDRLEIGKAILNSYLHQVLDVGIFHGDPHQGNIMLCKGVPYWIDFGMMGRIGETGVSLMQDLLFSIIQQDVEAMTNAALALGTVTGKINKSRLMEDLESFSTKYMSAKNLNEIDIGTMLTELLDLLADHNIAVSGEYTMMIRSLVTVEGVLEMLCPEIDIFGFLKDKMMERAKESLDLKEKLTSSVESIAQTALRTARLPGLASDVLRNMVKGRFKVSFELIGYEEPLRIIIELVKNILIAAFACVLFAGACSLSKTTIGPMVDSVPLVCLIGFISSVALAIYSIRNLVKISEKL